MIGDPMAGCGTVAVEAASSGKDGFYSDIDPLACLLVRAKAQPVEPKWLIETINEILSSCKPFAGPRTLQRDAIKAISDLERSSSFRAPPNVFHWFKPYVIVNLCRVLLSIDVLDTTPRREQALLSVIASVIRRLSRADPNTASGLEVTKIRLEELRNGLQFDAESEIRRKANVLSQGYSAIRGVPAIGKVTVVEGDAKKWSELCRKHDVKPDLVITSPCYMSAIEYWRRHKLEYCWLGLVSPENLPDIHHKFLGMGEELPDVESMPSFVQRLHRKLKRKGFTSDAQSLARYFNDSRSWLSEMASVLRNSKGVAYVVVGSNMTRGMKVDTPRALLAIAKEAGLKGGVMLRYRIVNYHMQYPTKSGMRIKTETVLKLVSN
jgi:hypothetical protein